MSLQSRLASLITAIGLDIKDLKSRIPALVTVLPGSPFDGQEVFFNADSTNGVIWHLRYRSPASGGGTYGWEYVGGPPLTSVQTASAGIGVGWQDVPQMSAITCALPGVYDAMAKCDCYANAAPGVPCTAALGVAVGASTPAATDYVEHYISAAQTRAPMTTFGRLTVLSPGGDIRIRANPQGMVGGQFMTFDKRRLYVCPVRVSPA
jgi:hypothetical protein